jgi:hypothetical protein
MTSSYLPYLRYPTASGGPNWIALSLAGSELAGRFGWCSFLFSLVLFRYPLAPFWPESLDLLTAWTPTRASDPSDAQSGVIIQVVYTWKIQWAAFLVYYAIARLGVYFGHLMLVCWYYVQSSYV